MKEIIKGSINYTKDNTDKLLIPIRNIDFEKRSLEKARVCICKICEYLDTSLLFKKLKDEQYPKIAGRKCSKCGCILSLKIRSNSKCPINKW